jgi:hypothetical protein
MTEAFSIANRSGSPNFIVVGDYNFDSTWTQEEQVITDNGMRDVVHDFYDQEAYTMRKSVKWGSWRPDKMVSKVG